MPHLIYDGSASDAERYPVQIGHADAPDACVDLLISLKRETPADYARFARVAELILNDVDEKSSSRARFRFYREHGFEPKTHKIS